MKYQILLILFAVSLVTTALIHIGATNTLCKPGEVSGCLIVSSSEYAYTFGMKNTSLGILAFSLMMFLIFLQLKKRNEALDKLILLGATIIGIFALYFIYLQLFIIGYICAYCIVVDVSSLIALGILLFNR